VEEQEVAGVVQVLALNAALRTQAIVIHQQNVLEWEQTGVEHGVQHQIALYVTLITLTIVIQKETVKGQVNLIGVKDQVEQVAVGAQQVLVLFVMSKTIGIVIQKQNVKVLELTGAKLQEQVQGGARNKKVVVEEAEAGIAQAVIRLGVLQNQIAKL